MASTAVAVAASAMVPGAAVLAQSNFEQVQTRSFITPFPKGDVYRVQLYGDSWAESLLSSAARTLGKDARLRVQRKVVTLNGLATSRWDRYVRAIEALKEADVPEIAVVMAGIADHGPLRSANSERIRLSAPEAWRRGYSERIERLFQAFAAKKIAVYWIGQPIMRSNKRSTHAALINEIARAAAQRSRIKFIDTYDSFAEENGGYTDYGPDLSGKVRRLRWRDGIHFMTAGYDRIIHFVEREIRRDLRQARKERSVKLLGDEVQQKAVHARAKRSEAQPGGGASSWPSLLTPFLGGSAPKPAKLAKSKSWQVLDKRGGLAQATSSASITVANEAAQGRGRQQRLKITIERPAVAPPVVALVRQRARENKRTKFGDRIVLSTAGGKPLLTSVTPSNRGRFDLLRSRAAPTQTAIFKVWAKGERLAPRESRADDVSWPRPQPVVLIRNRPPPARQIGRVDPLLAFDRLKPYDDYDGPPVPGRNPLANF